MCTVLDEFDGFVFVYLFVFLSGSVFTSVL